MFKEPYGEVLVRFFMDSSKKMELHSWNDVNFLRLLYFLQIEIDEFPEGTIAVAIELHNDNGEEHIKVS